MTYSDKKTCIVGAGGFGREVLCCLIDTLQDKDVKIEDVACFMVDDAYLNDSTIMGVPVIARSQFDPALYNVIVAIGDPINRMNVVQSLPPHTTYCSIIHPSAVISKWVQIGEGSIVTAGTIITCNIQIGRHAHLNLHTTVGHDCIIGDYFTSAPGVNISGNCHLGDCVYFGTNSSVKQGVKIQSHVTIGMGAVVVKDIAEAGIYVGNPLRKMEKP